MAIAYDNTKTYDSIASSTTTFLVGSEANRYLFVVTSQRCTALTFDGVSMTQLIYFEPFIHDGNQQIVVLWGLANPSSGTKTLAPTMTGTGTLSMVSYSGVFGVQPEVYTPDFSHTLAPDINTQVGFLSTAVTTFTDKAWTVMFSCGGNNNQNFIAGTGTLRTSGYNLFGDGTRGIIDSNALISPPASSTLRVDWASGSGFISNIIISMKPQPPFSGQMTII